METGIISQIELQSRQSKRILWALSSYYPEIGGLEISCFSRISLLKNEFGQLVLSNTSYGDRVVDGIPIIEIDGELKGSIERLIDKFQPHFIATAGSISHPAIEVALQNNIPVVYFLGAPNTASFDYFKSCGNVRVIANSEWIKDAFEKTSGGKALMLYPPVLPWHVIAKRKNPNQKIVHVGDSYVKGGKRIYDLACKANTENFVVTKNWLQLRDANGWDNEKILQLKHNDGSTTIFESEIPDFSSLSNVEYLNPYIDPKQLYEQCEILLVASKWREPFGRIIVEGLLNKLPVIVSKEAYDKRWEGLVYYVEQADNPDEWVRVIENIREKHHNSCIKTNVEKYSSDYSTSDAFHQLRTLAFNEAT